MLAAVLLALLLAICGCACVTISVTNGHGGVRSLFFLVGVILTILAVVLLVGYGFEEKGLFSPSS